MHITLARLAPYTFCAGILLLGGCGALLYSPQAHVAPLFERGGQARFAGQIERDGGVSGYVAVSPLRHTFAFATYGYTDRESFAKRVAEYGGGVYVPLGAGATVEVLAGAGRGRYAGDGTLMRPDDGGTFPHLQAFTYRARQRSRFAQIALGGRPEDDLLAAVVVRLAHVRYTDLRYSGRGADAADLATEVDALFAEPGLLFRVRLTAGFSFEGQLGLSLPLMNEGWRDFEQQPQYTSLGLHVDLGR